MRYENTDHDRSFFDEMAGPNNLQIVLKAALYVEHELDSLIRASLVHPTALAKVHLDFHKKSAITIALGLDPRLHRALNALGTIRNTFAHQLKAELGQSEAKNFYNAFSPADQRIIHSHYERLARLNDGPKFPARFSSLDPADRFRLCAITLRSAIIAGRLQIERAKNNSSLMLLNEVLKVENQTKPDPKMR